MDTAPSAPQLDEYGIHRRLLVTVASGHGSLGTQRGDDAIAMALP